MVRVLIADADESCRTLLSARLEREADLCLAGCAGSGEDALALLAEKGADVLLLELVLPRGDGLYVMERLRAMPIRPKVVVHTAFLSQVLLERCAALGAAAVLLKPSEPDSVFDHLRFAGATNVQPSPSIPQCDDYARVTALLRQAGFSAHYHGYHYLRAAVLAALEQGPIFDVTKDVYPAVARQFHTTPAAVERAIRTMTGSLRRSAGRGEALGLGAARCTNAALIARLADELRTEGYAKSG
jgi:two-component system response regulator (stage 0 sporulation protein A)